MNPNESPDTTENEETTETTRELGEALLGAGAAWARYGLTVARASLGAGARTLDATSGLLATLSDRLGETLDPKKPDTDTGA